MNELDRSHLGQYRLIRQLVAGGMGAVFEAEDPRLQRRVALKTLPEHLVKDAEQLLRLEREAQTLASLSHPNIVTIFTVEEDDGVVFLTMEWVDGEPLSRCIPTHGLPLETFFHYALQIAEALDAAHQKGVIHRDVKPGNIMVNTEGRIKVLDFGLAKRGEPFGDESSGSGPDESRTLTREGQMLGTLPYMSPEQLQGGPVDHRTDIFSLGIVLYEMAAGERPFKGSSWGDLASSILRDEPPSVSRLSVDLPRHLGRILRHCLEKDVKRRFQTALDLRNELAELQREIATGELPSRPNRGAGKRRTGWIVAGMTAIAAAFWALPPDLWQREGLTELGRQAPKTIAITPFENLGPEDERYFAAGVTDEITSHLSSVKSLRVVSRKTSGEALDTDYLLTGTVRWDPAPEEGKRRVRVTPRLIRVLDGAHIWSESYERVIDDLFAVQSQIAVEVIRQMDIVLLEPERQAMDERPTENLEAFRAYLQGMDLAGRRDPTSRHWEQAVERFEEAVRLDPNFALAWAELSEVHSFVYQLRLDRTEDRLAEARRTADRALDLNPELPQGHRALGYFYYWGRRDFDSALAAFERAEEGLPNDSQVLGGIAYVKRRQGRFEEASRYLLRALADDPESTWLATEVAITYQTMRSYREADRYFAQAIALAPDESAVYRRRAKNYLLWHGDLSSARDMLEAMPDQRSTSSIIAWYELEMNAGNSKQARQFLELSSTTIFGDETGYWPKLFLEARALRLGGSKRVSLTFFELAQRPLKSGLASSPEDERLHAALGLCYGGSGDREPALFHARRAVELMPLAKDALVGAKMLENLAATRAELGDVDEAMEILEELLRVPAEISLPLIRIDPKWKNLWETERFERFVDDRTQRTEEGRGSA